MRSTRSRPTPTASHASPRSHAHTWTTGRRPRRDSCGGSIRPVTTRCTTRSQRPSRRGMRGSSPCGPAPSWAPPPDCTSPSSCCARSSTAPTATPSSGWPRSGDGVRRSTPRSRRSSPGRCRCSSRPGAGPLSAVHVHRARALSDFREVEENFRRLDRAARERSRPGTAPRECCSRTWSARAPTSLTPTRARASRPSTTSSSPSPARRSSRHCRPRRPPRRGRRRQSAPGSSTTTGQRPPSGPNAQCASPAAPPLPRRPGVVGGTACSPLSARSRQPPSRSGRSARVRSGDR